MQRVLAGAIAVLLAAGLLGAFQRTGSRADRGGESDLTVGANFTAADPGALRPGAGQVVVTGTVTSLEMGTAAADGLAFPLTLEADEQGAGRAHIEPAIVDRKPGAVLAWDSGRPLPITGAGSLEFAGPVRLAIVAGQARWYLDGAARRMTAGSYRLGSTVAVGRAGLAQPRDAVAFDAGQKTTLQTAHGVYVVASEDVHAEGPSGLTARGRLRMEHPDGSTESVSGIDFRNGPLLVDLTREGDTWKIRALLQGAVVAVS